MESSELIELFYHRTYEKFVDKKILDDKDYIIPRQQLINYVHELIKIPYADFIKYIKNNSEKQEIVVSDITQFSSFSVCEIEMCNALLWANNPGCQFMDIGRLFPNKVSHRNAGAYRKYGENHIKASTQLGLTFEYYGYWYLSCIGYIYPNLDEGVRERLLARTIIRNGFYSQMLIDILEHDVNPEDYMSKLSDETIKRRFRNVCTFFGICLRECCREGITTYKIIRNNIETNQLVISELFNPALDSSEKDVIKKKDDESINEVIDQTWLQESTQYVRIGSPETLRIYMNEISKYRISSEGQTMALFEQLKDGDKGAYDLIVKGNQKLVISIALLFKNRGIPLEDLIQEGNMGLIASIYRFDPRSNVFFSYYASNKIYRTILDSLRSQSYLLTIPQNTIVEHEKLRRYLEKREQENEFEPPITKEEAEQLLGTSNLTNFCYLPKDLLTMTESVDLDSFEGDMPPTDDSLMKESRSIYVKSLLGNLSKRDQIFVTKFYGIGCPQETLEQIADTYGLTRERVRQIVEKSRHRLQEILGLRKKEKKDHKTSTKSLSSEKTTQTAQIIKSHANGNELYSPFTTLQQLCIVGVLTRKECKQCHHKGLWTIGDVQKRIEKYNLTPESTRFTKYTLDIWFKIVGLLDKREQNAKKVITLKPTPKPVPKPTLTSSTRVISDMTYKIYTQKIMKLYQSYKNGVVNVAKPVLLLAIIDGVGLGEIQYNRILLDERLEERYNGLMKIYSNFFVYRKITPINMPFWYLQTDGFWHLRIKGDKKIGAPTTNWLKENVLYAFLDEDLWFFLQIEMCRKLLRDFIIEHKLTT